MSDLPMDLTVTLQEVRDHPSYRPSRDALDSLIDRLAGPEVSGWPAQKLVVVFQRAGTDDVSHEIEVTDVVIDGLSIEDGGNDRTIARVEVQTDGGVIFRPTGVVQMGGFDTVTVVPKR